VQGNATAHVRPSDPRAIRTRTKLMAALVDLATRKDLDEISIGELTAAAGVNRATFYLHYSDKEGLLLDAVRALTDEISVGAAAASGKDFADPDRAPLHTLAFFAELDRSAALYRRVLGPAGSPAVQASLHDGLRRAITDEIMHRSADRTIDERSTERSAAFLTGGVIAAAIAWLDDDKRAPATAEAAAVWRMVLASSAALQGQTTPGDRQHVTALDQPITPRSLNARPT
jgi:AcrR family transcriptional regulator